MGKLTFWLLSLLCFTALTHAARSLDVFTSLKPVQTLDFKGVFSDSNLFQNSQECFSVKPKPNALEFTYNLATCNTCGKVKLDLGVSGQKVSVPLEISCQADVVVAHNRCNKQIPYKKSLQNYLSSLASEKLSSLVVNLCFFDDPAHRFIPYPIGEKQFLRSMDRINDVSKPRYLVLLGDTYKIPQPDIGDPAGQLPSGCMFSVAPPCELPSDRSYAKLDKNNRYVVRVARIPGDDLLVSTLLANYAFLHRKGGLSFAQKDAVIAADACGGTKTTTRAERTYLVPNCILYDILISGLSGLGKKACTPAENCFTSPPYCQSCSDSSVTCKVDELSRKVNGAPFLFLDEHGSGTALYAYSVLRGKSLECRVEHFDRHVFALVKSPIVVTSACYGAALDKDYQGKSLFHDFSSPLSLQLLSKYASIYIGVTRANIDHKLQARITLDSSSIKEYTALLYQSQQIAHAMLTCRGRAGDCFYDQMESYERIIHNPYAKDTLLTEKTARQFQFYGDPTLPVYVS